MSFSGLDRCSAIASGHIPVKWSSSTVSSSGHRPSLLWKYPSSSWKLFLCSDILFATSDRSNVPSFSRSENPWLVTPRNAHTSWKYLADTGTPPIHRYTVAIPSVSAYLRIASPSLHRSRKLSFPLTVDRPHLGHAFGASSPELHSIPQNPQDLCATDGSPLHAGHLRDPVEGM